LRDARSADCHGLDNHCAIFLGAQGQMSQRAVEISGRGGALFVPRSGVECERWCNYFARISAQSSRQWLSFSSGPAIKSSIVHCNATCSGEFLTWAWRSCYNRCGGGNSSTGRAPDCGSDGCGFDSRFPPQIFSGGPSSAASLAALGWTGEAPVLT
jgi:hypothetical protein